jgi:diadenosine tetraphosphate (Ap4A) HIT family hydrolase
MSDQKLKILLFGRIGDEIEAFVAKLGALHSSKAGPFDAAFAVGACNTQMLLNKTLPVPLYVQEPLQDLEKIAGEVKQEEHGEDEESNCFKVHDSLYVLRNPTAPFAPNVWSLTVAPKKPPLVVAVCPSLWRMPEKATEDTASSPLLKMLNHVSYTGCDLLLSSEWPQGVEQTLGEANAVETARPNLSFDVAQIALRARARYHVAVGDSFVQSNPYGHLTATTSTVACYHTGRFLALGPVLDNAAWKQVADKKKAKYVHALGLQPLHSLSQAEIMAQRPSSGLLPCPYTDESYYTDGPPRGKSNPQSHSISSRNNPAGLSEAQARRILAEEHSKGGGHRFHKNQKARDSDKEPEFIDPSNQSLFVHGLHRDVTGILQSRRGNDVLFQSFARFGATGIRKPPNAETSSFAFVDFPTHEKALACWTDLGGNINVNGVDLTVRWATHKRKAGNQEDGPANAKRRRLTEKEARDSSTIFFSMGRQFKTENDGNTLEKHGERLRVWMEETLEEALAGGDGERVKAADEPALQVQMRLPTDHSEERSFGFLEFASHAAASMALATVTGSTDGGMVLPEAPALPGKEFESVRLHWGHSKPKNAKEQEFVEDPESGFRFERKHFPVDSRRDCWFCLASESCEKHLITGVYDQCYSAMPKGPIHEGHVLLVPVQHTSQGALVDDKLSEEMDKLKAALREHASKEYDMDLFIFERAMQTKGGYHTHVQCVPVPRQKGMEIRATMVAQARRSNADIREITSDLGVAAVIGSSEDDRGYFYAEIPVSSSDYRRFLYKAGENGSLPLQFGREVVATVLRKPDLAHWKSCVVDKEKEGELAAKLRESLSGYTT